MHNFKLAIISVEATIFLVIFVRFYYKKMRPQTGTMKFTLSTFTFIILIQLIFEITVNVYRYVIVNDEKYEHILITIIDNFFFVTQNSLNAIFIWVMLKMRLTEILVSQDA